MSVFVRACACVTVCVLGACRQLQFCSCAALRVQIWWANAGPYLSARFLRLRDTLHPPDGGAPPSATAAGRGRRSLPMRCAEPSLQCLAHSVAAVRRTARAALRCLADRSLPCALHAPAAPPHRRGGSVGARLHWMPPCCTRLFNRRCAPAALSHGLRDRCVLHAAAAVRHAPSPRLTPHAAAAHSDGAFIAVWPRADNVVTRPHAVPLYACGSRAQPGRTRAGARARARAAAKEREDPVSHRCTGQCRLRRMGWDGTWRGG